MRLLPFLSCLVFLCSSPLVSAIRLIESNSLNPCQDNSSFTASLFNVVFTPDNRSIAIDIVGVSSISGHVVAELEVIAYGYTAITKTLNPCEMNLEGLCPMNTGQINIKTNILDIPQSVIDAIPGIAFQVPDLDGEVRVYINSTTTGESIACVQADLSNGKTVYQKGVGWATAVIAGLGLAASAITSGLGHSNTAAHVAANALSLFSFMQAQAMIGLTSIHLPPIVQSWTQNFQWSMGIIHVGFMQTICTWYQRSTGGTPSVILTKLATTSVSVQKRSLEYVQDLAVRAGNHIMKRANSDSGNTKAIVVRGINRVGFRADIEETNIFMTGLIFFIVFVGFVMLFVALFKGICELLVKSGKMKSDKFQDFRNGWKIVLRGILFRLTLIGYPQMCVLCLWEFTKRDSAAEVLLAVIMFVSMTGALGWAALKVIRLAKRSVSMHKNPAYILYSDPTCLNKWGFLYVQYRATAYYFVVPVLVYILVKSMFIGLSQAAPTVQAVALVIIEALVLIGVCVLRPWMDKKTNVYNISIAAVNFLNVIFLLVFSDVFDQPGIVTGVMGVVFFIYNAVFALTLLILVLIASIYAVVSKDPDTRYQPMRDDRGSFIKSQTQLTTELDALGATARGELKPGQYKSGFDDDDTSFSSGNGASIGRQNDDSIAVPQHAARQSPHSPVDPSVPLFPSNGSSNSSSQSRGPPPSYNNGYSTTEYVGRTPSPAPGSRGGATLANPQAFRAQHNASPWQRGAGYEH
ncbi:hypothetical protein DTO164E3_2839 [Paecilomyces variotii]|uniref:ML-like domain-containing protein n=1 Tax=Byssochlamys spectabilis TaxID=264951 RepID=A0A443HN01_BYSSP|nr:hypothetical protein C8Q69DRAFT_62180 [Paecilomyces variotii]KAJ9200031.1 hypothetical protein DTO032I3_4756 [Paecilomyces variotii]KAJ9202866.1 hypothetical protein DTO164E3_2839 [Paecilomyces variotii]KAJ9278765.1 hypothetical protein DTO021D3_4388 [Paecilomyces variotii]KAJ9289670.1 hypothetical protein DTO021C3_2741 [Paecilomyces variotii]KAJ9309066.1 hypothetical protein DTO217A2_1435 [Paecilomyces variotii]